ncbi:low molecular weight phosphotyrosine protein phosphatase [Halomonas piscis]|uniref:protein-tyrosine-phosphatase n=1 Tax=Halomonas piscis TaxID=3031727 RepID=A0ABY9Z2Z1_9GAMM|nr:low molecular weight protein-tyrosine-phosphatase [Halomonas piscis]WNK21450.1 low molecular weight phosphotyrosine protein phosphatase [Halomonas piscis]
MKVLFVCLGNICRSPSAEGVFRRAVEQAGLEPHVTVDSCGIGDWHAGNPPDERAQAAAKRRGLDIGNLRARQLGREDFDEFDYILPMDYGNLRDIRAMEPEGHGAHIELFLAFAGMPQGEVPDPYYGGEQGFEEVLDMIEAASQGLVEHIQAAR